MGEGSGVRRRGGGIAMLISYRRFAPRLQPAGERGDGGHQLGRVDRLRQVHLETRGEGADPVLGAGVGGQRRGRHLAAAAAPAARGSCGSTSSRPPPACRCRRPGRPGARGRAPPGRRAPSRRAVLARRTARGRWPAARARPPRRPQRARAGRRGGPESFPAPARSGMPPSATAGPPRLPPIGSRTVKVAPCPSPALSAADRAAVQLDEVAHDRQAEPEAAVLARGRARRPGGSARRRAAGTPARCPARCRCTEISTLRSPSRASSTSHAAARGRELDRVREQVPDDLLQAVAGRRRSAPSARVDVRTSRRMLFASAAGRTASSAASTTARRSTGSTSRRSLPVMMRDTSSRSSMSCACARALRSMVSSARARASRSSSVPDAQQVRPSRGWR